MPSTTDTIAQGGKVRESLYMKQRNTELLNVGLETL